MTEEQNKLAEAAERAVHVLAEIMDSHFGPHRHFECTKCETMAVRVMDELNAALRAEREPATEAVLAGLLQRWIVAPMREGSWDYIELKMETENALKG